MTNKEHRQPRMQPDTSNITQLIEQSRQGLAEVMPTSFVEILPGMRTDSVCMILDFSQFPENLPEYQNIQKFFAQSEANGENPRLPENRQRFNDQFLRKSGKRYLIGRYAENRIAMLQGSSIAAEGRTYHMGIDIFTEGLEMLYAPYPGRVVRVGQEPGKHAYGYFVILKHVFDQTTLYSFYGHLDRNLPNLGSFIDGGAPLARMGDYIDDENGGWSRHVHFQLSTELPVDTPYPLGYSSLENLPKSIQKSPDPNLFLQLPDLNLR